MKTFLAIFMIAMLFCVPYACADDAQTSEALWYELSGENTVLTVRLPGNSKDGMDWTFEISNPEALELIT